MEKTKKLKFNFVRFLNTGILAPLIGFGLVTSAILFLILFYLVKA